MKRFATILTLLLAAACAPAPRGDLRASLSREQLDRSDSAILLAEARQSGFSATLVPIGDRDGVITWKTAQNQTLSFRGGVLIATRGFGDDLMSADASGTLAALKGGPQSGYSRLLTFLDGEGKTVFRAMVCQMEPPAPATLETIGLAVPVTLHRETCNGTGLSVENRYWQASDGRLRRSEQWIGPRLGKIRTELLTR